MRLKFPVWLPLDVFQEKRSWPLTSYIVHPVREHFKTSQEETEQVVGEKDICRVSLIPPGRQKQTIFACLPALLCACTKWETFLSYYNISSLAQVIMPHRFQSLAVIKPKASVQIHGQIANPQITDEAMFFGLLYILTFWSPHWWCT